MRETAEQSPVLVRKPGQVHASEFAQVGDGRLVAGDVGRHGAQP